MSRGYRLIEPGLDIRIDPLVQVWPTNSSVCVGYSSYRGHLILTVNRLKAVIVNSAKRNRPSLHTQKWPLVLKCAPARQTVHAVRRVSSRRVLVTLTGCAFDAVRKEL